MPFSDLRDNLILIDDQIDTNEHDLPFVSEIDAPTIYPSDPEYFIRVYYDASRFSCEHALQDLFGRMQAEYAPRSIGLVDLDPKSLEYRSLSPFPNMEKLFLNRGFVADVEGRVFRVGHVASTRFAKRNMDAVTANAMVMAALLDGPGHGLLPQADEDETRVQLVHRVMAPVMGKETIYRSQELPAPCMIYPLAEHQGLLLGCTDFSNARHLHWAFETTPGQAIDQGGRQSPRDSLFERKMQLVRKQILFEAQNVARLLAPERLDPDLPHSNVTPTMIITWYSQAIAAMRKVCWLVSAEQEASIVAHSLTLEKALHSHVIGAPSLPDNERTWDHFIEDQVDRRNEEIAEFAQDWGPIRGPIDLTCKIAWDDELLAALMGATYRSDTDLSESPYQNPDIFVRCLAYWIGSLKRKRTATIEWYTAEGILEVCRHQYRWPLLLSQFPKATWVELEEIAEAITNGGPVTEIEVHYTWTQDLDAPYKCEERDGMLVLEGPLLCFPALAADEWREKSRTIETLRGFEVKGARRR
jgi:hypothetical protein